jgi:hypothetical protein
MDKTPSKHPETTIGTYVTRPPVPPEITCDDPELRPHLGSPWLHDWLALNGDAVFLPTSSGTVAAPPDAEAVLDAASLARHALIVGTSGSGKSRLATHLALEQLKAGCSLVFLDPKDQTVLEVLAAVQRTGVRPEQVTLALPTHGHPPAWNPLDARALGISAYEAAKEFVDVLREIHGDGARMIDILTNALTLASAHGYTLFEAAELLRSPAYREGFLREKKDPLPSIVDADTYAEVLRFFQEEYPAMTKGGNSLDAVLPALNKLREPLRSPYLRGMFCPSEGQPTFDIASLWREPKVLLVNLHRKALGNEGAELLGGLLLQQLLGMAVRTGGKGGNPVVLFLDEIAFSQKFLGSGAGEMLGMARSYDLRLVAACQHLAKINPELRADLLTAAVKAFFKLSAEDASAVSELAALGSSGADSGPRSFRLSVAARRAGVAEREEARYPLLDARGGELAIRATAWEALGERPQEKRVEALESLMRASHLPAPACVGLLPGMSGGTDTGVPADSESLSLVAVSSLVQGLPPADWDLEGPDPARLVVRFPRPKATPSGRETAADRARAWKHLLLNQGQREALLFSPMKPGAHEIKVAHVPDPAGAPEFLDAVLARGQSDEAVAAGMADRRAEVQVLTRPGGEAGEGAVATEGAENAPKKADGGKANKTRKPAAPGGDTAKKRAAKTRLPLPERAQPREEGLDDSI